jgi:hypothetical protein
VRGSGGNGTGSVGMRQSFHNSTLAGEREGFRTSRDEIPLESVKNKKMFVSLEFAADSGNRPGAADRPPVTPSQLGFRLVRAFTNAARRRPTAIPRG